MCGGGIEGYDAALEGLIFFPRMVPHFFKDLTITTMGTAVIALASLAATAVSTGISFYGQRQQAKSQAYASEYNAKVAENEARNAQLEATEYQKRKRQQNRREMAGVRNQLAASGTLTTSGTSLDILGEQSANMELEISDAARASRIQTDSYYAKAEMARWEGKQLQRATRISSYGTLFSGVSQMASGYSDFRSKNTLF